VCLCAGVFAGQKAGRRTAISGAPEEYNYQYLPI
jgi:hypothetical protein